MSLSKKHKQLSSTKSINGIKARNMYVISLDKISVTIPIEKNLQADVLKAFCANFLNFDSDSICIEEARTYGYASTYRIRHVSNKGEISEAFIQMQIGPYLSGRNFIRVEYNPSKFSPAWINEEANAYFQMSLGMDFFEMLSLGNVTRLDICIDIFNTRLNDIVVDVKYKSLMSTFVKSGILQTVYYGHRNKNAVKIYQKDIQDTDYPKHTVRIERSINSNLSVPHLHSVANPFLGIKVFKPHISERDSQVKRARFYSFLAHCRCDGLKNVKRNYRAEYSKFLKRVKKSEINFYSSQRWEKDLEMVLRRGNLYKLGSITYKKSSSIAY